MENYFICKQFVNIILNNLNYEFISALRISHSDQKYDEKNKNFINYIINKIQEMLTQHNKQQYDSYKSDITAHVLNYLQDNSYDRKFIKDIIEFAKTS
jgi:6-phosphogluconate dehydrogenase